MKYKIFALASIALMLCSCNDFLSSGAKDKIEDNPDFWNDEGNIRTSFFKYYDLYFEGYNSGWSRSDWFYNTNVADWTDDNAQEAATTFTKVAPPAETDASATKKDERNWTFSYVREFNTLINKISASKLDKEAKEHWLGIGRFFRGLEYAKLVSKFGDVPWYSQALESKDYNALYKERQPREVIMDSVLKDFEYASTHIRKNDFVEGVSVNRFVAEAFASRAMLFEGTWQKYREKNTGAAKKYLEFALKMCEDVMKNGHYIISDDYKALTTSIDLKGNPEVLLYRSYVDGIVTHSLMSFQNTEAEISSPSKDLIDSYLSKNGLPISQTGNKQYKGDKWFFDEIADRDPRLSATIDVSGLKLNGVEKIYAVSGYFANRFVNETLKDQPGGKSATNITDAPIMKFNEVLLNYLEAAAELSALGARAITQMDVDMTINKIRDRKGVQMPHVTLAGQSFSVNGITIEDPSKDADVSSLIWEIRRERRTELVYEGIRFNDLRRWNKLQYADMKLNKKLNLGAWLDKPKFIEWYNKTFNPTKPITLKSLETVFLDRSGDAGYIKPIRNENSVRVYAEKDYLYPIPIDQITLYEKNGKKLKQNPGW